MGSIPGEQPPKHKRNILAGIDLLAAMSDAISVQDTDLRILYQNPAHKRLMGEHVGEYCYTAYQHQDEVCEGCHLVRSFTDGRCHQRETSAVTDRGLRYVEISSSPLRDADGTIIAGIESIRDITERRENEERLRIQQAAMEASPNGICIFDLTRDSCLYVNPAYVGIFGYDSAEELLGRSWHVLFPPDEIARYEAIGASFQRDGKWLGELTGLRQDGSTFPVQISAAMIGDGKAVAVVNDITERKRAENALANSERFLKTIIDTEPECIKLLDADSNLLMMNPAGLAMIEADSFEQVRGQCICPIVTSPYRDAFMALTKQVFQGIPGTLEFETIGLKGRHVWLETHAVPFRNEHDEIVSLLGITRDITERKMAEAQILQMNQELRERATELAAMNREMESFSYSVSHDLKTPLSSIYTGVQILTEEHTPHLDETGRFVINAIARAAEKMNDLLDAMLILSRVARTELQHEEVDLSMIAREILLQLQTDHPERKVEWVVAPGIEVTGDPRLLRSVLDNLMGNAWKYTRTRDVARIEFGRVQREGQDVYFVRDNGVGFSPEESARLFHPFQRLHGDEQFEGTGIGLATVQRIICRHGGVVWGEGKVGAGASFYFTLPSRE